MSLRQPCAQNFYPGDIAQQIDQFIQDYTPPRIEEKPCSGIVPHAGWIFSGAVTAKTFACLKEYNQVPDSIVCFGAIHGFVYQHSVDPEGAWWTPLGSIEIDEELASEIINEGNGLVVADRSAHSDEHSLEVQMPMIKYFFPDVKIVPIAAVPQPNASEIGVLAAKIAMNQSKDILFIGTTDLTHYGKSYHFTPKGKGEKAHKWAKKNDELMLERILKMDIDHILKEAKDHSNSCGPGAVTATLAAAKEMGHTNPVVLEHIKSFEIMPDPVYQMSVGYASVVI